MSFLGWYWDSPWLLLLLLLLPLLAWRAGSLATRGRVPVPNGRQLATLPSIRASVWWLPDLLRALAIAALIVAVARPQTKGIAKNAGEGVDIMLALDMSVSMNTVDADAAELEKTLAADEVPKNRFEVARKLLEEFTISRNKVSQDRIGLTVFGRQAWLKFPPTHDHSRLVRTLSELVLDNGRQDRRTGKCSNGCTIDGGGTAIGDAMGRAYNRLRRSDSKAKIVLLITDGSEKGSTVDARALARHIRDLPPEQQVRVYTFLVGDQRQTWLPQIDMSGRHMKDSRGRLVYRPPAQPFPIDPELLRDIAQQTDGKFYESYNAEKFREDIADLERTVFQAAVEYDRNDAYHWPLIVGLLLLALEWLLRVTWLRSIV